MNIAEVYHKETKYHEREMFRHNKGLDFSRQPLPYKTYEGGQKIALAPFLSSTLEKPREQDQGVSFEKGRLARLLHAANGMTARLQYPDGQSLPLRAAPTAGGLYPTEIYMAIRAVPDLADGIYNFQVNDHSLVLVWEGDYWSSFQKYCMGHEVLALSHFMIILTGVYQRSTWRYAERAYRRILLDTGHILGNITAYAPEEGFRPCPIGGFWDGPLNGLLFLDPLEEGVLTVVALPPSENSASPVGSLAIPSSPHRTEITPPTRALQLHFASSLVSGEQALITPVATATSEEPHPLGAVAVPQALSGSNALPERNTEEETILSGMSLPWPEGVGPAIRIRRSTRQFTGEALMQEELAAILAYAYEPVTPPSFLFCPSLLTTYLVIQKVIGLPGGVYQYDPVKKSVVRARGGQFHEVTFHFCLGQALARDAAVLVIHTAHLPTALNQYGDRAYRYLHMDAGHIGERLNLAAVQMGLGVSGIGGFYDDEVNTLLDLSLDSIIVYMTTLGRPA